MGVVKRGLRYERAKSFQQASRDEMLIDEGSFLPGEPWDTREEPDILDSEDQDPQWDYSDEDPWDLALAEEESEEEV